MKVTYFGDRIDKHIAASVVGSVRDVLDTRADHESRATAKVIKKFCDVPAMILLA